MKFVLFCHSLVSDWNHGNAHFLRGIVAELLDRGHAVSVYEPEDAWSRQQLEAEHGTEPVTAFSGAFPQLHSHRYQPDTLDLDEALDDADVVLVHEWNDPDLVARIGAARSQRGDFTLLFHDTNQRAITARQDMPAYDLDGYDGVLASGEAVRQRYQDDGWAARAWAWHAAADVRVFRPYGGVRAQGDLVWIGNWGDQPRVRELDEFLIDPVASLGLFARVHGARFPHAAVSRLTESGIEYGGWVPNWRLPQVFAAFRVTVHIPRRAEVRGLPGVPAMRLFEALACGIPLVSAPWYDTEGLFARGRDFLMARDYRQMRRHLHDVLHDHELASELRENGLRTIRSRHTCAHRVDELMHLLAGLGRSAPRRAAAGDGVRRGRSLHA